MSRLQQLVPCCLSSILILTALLLCRRNANVGTSHYYDPPHTLATCGYDPSQFPSGLLFASAGERIWDNGAACGRQYSVRCIGGDWQKACRPVQWIHIMIVDRALDIVSHSSSDGATMLLSITAYKAIADLSAKSIKIEFEPV
ncbi:hypothetical protein ACJRO7_014473 [Eucalyptus globulus]|uniref:Expansin-like EG45 domain-containing protein n=1 Tax=Eucalyptus globulus TaxID=34317 RepID=A0ABD3L482_EUCGL